MSYKIPLYYRDIKSLVKTLFHNFVKCLYKERHLVFCFFVLQDALHFHLVITAKGSAGVGSMAAVTRSQEHAIVI